MADRRLTGEQTSDTQQAVSILIDDLMDLDDHLAEKASVEDLLNLAHEAQGKLNQIVTKLEDINDV